ncbi:ribosome biogenesis protein SLX9 homolog [Garra rufa]|uniref:ribosome biogenesis protein SLX9 homolog n=1 Tax=Garra rufa TaxID=137080 RepID=UPI003CCE832D
MNRQAREVTEVSKAVKPSRLSVTASLQSFTGEKKQSKKEKMKERRERWLNKISAIKLAREQQVAQARRKATPVVGDMRPLADALPELSQLLPSLRTPGSTQRKNKTPVKKKPETTNYSQMKPAQKRKLLETEASHFREALKNPAFKTNPLLAIGEHLRKRLKQEDEQS